MKFQICSLPEFKSFLYHTVSLISCVVKKTFEFLAQYSKFHEVDFAIISQFQYKHEAQTYESFFDQAGSYYFF